MLEQPPKVSNEAYVTLVTRDDYGLGAIVLAHSLQDVGTTRPLLCLVTSRVSGLMLDRLREVFDQLVMVDPIATPSLDNLQLLGRPELSETLTKLHVWTMTQFQRVIFLDADTLVLSNVDELFATLPPLPQPQAQQRGGDGNGSEVELCAVTDNGWPDCFNSGVFVCRPSGETFTALLEHAKQQGSFDGGDQGLLNDYFQDKWKRLPYVFNVTPTASYSYAPAYQKFRHSIRIVHFAGMEKPWQWDRFTDGSVMPRGRGPLAAAELVQAWWKVHDRHIGRWGEKSAQKTAQLGHAPSMLSQSAHISGGGGLGMGGGEGAHALGTPFFGARYNWNERELGGMKRPPPSKFAAMRGDSMTNLEVSGSTGVGSRAATASSASAAGSGTSSGGGKPAGSGKAKK